jgi:hypothetical protein
MEPFQIWFHSLCPALFSTSPSLVQLFQSGYFLLSCSWNGLFLLHVFGHLLCQMPSPPLSSSQNPAHHSGPCLNVIFHDLFSGSIVLTPVAFTATTYLPYMCSFLGDSNEDWTQGLLLASQVLYHLSHVPSPFAFSLFPSRVSCFCLSWLWTEVLSPIPPK